MIKVCHQIGKQFVFASYPENDVEERDLQGLVRETKYLHSICDRVGLWILAEFQLNSRTVVVTSINDKADLGESDLVSLQATIFEKLKGGSYVKQIAEK
ncbi:MAG: hypothetical protein A3J06_03480 [Candidatus Moranbacteria bacterium RIFCSPLOWO2_02_FULL_48_19]|uniref:Uncharacterized protein n=1 Tax=Candidatus Magasanikbacteria bacterium GW2011_GWC2_45_8 TaxID=1619050 RepID=A0A0G1MXT9_9BACT|nr:MAG: hypothetical protein UX20_C0033G0002 [Candidatus Magasanikbacteria bacterium GW2011_GWC2_45_8]OGI18248.1 MAG: hypothetical protein A3J06_03480 [Candidatus Moranbacteria bacterium RIFCSPLOWO2_02_FULL_48_19]OGI31957.1 MAG: hypothetical protein A3G09_03300 [Candidatus Moranbacteria bacterium RIFCSPLOWO2_12_FULL_48_12]